MRWIAEHSDVITALTSIGTLLVWVVYLQLFATSYRRQQRATLLITHAAGDGLEARCFLSNMSSGPVYVASVVVTLEASARTTIRPVTDIRDAEGAMSEEGGRWTRQGFLESGETRDLGSFGGLIRQALARASAAPEHPDTLVRAVTIKAIGIYASEDLPVGACRTFVLHDAGDGPAVTGKELSTRQIRGRRNRRKLFADLEDDP